MKPTAAAPSRSSNEEHGIVPRSVARPIVDAGRRTFGCGRKGSEEGQGPAGRGRRGGRLPFAVAGTAGVRLKALEQQMYQHAKDLEFEDARVRDQIRQLKEASLG